MRSNRNESGPARSARPPVTFRSHLAQDHVDEANQSWDMPWDEDCSSRPSMMDRVAVCGMYGDPVDVPIAFMNPRRAPRWMAVAMT